MTEAKDGAIATDLYRRVMGKFTTGVAVVTAAAGQGGSIGLTINSFSSVSLEPPLILWSLSLRSVNLEAFRSAKSFAINILSQDQRDICRQFSRPVEDRFAGVSYRFGHGNAPLIEGAIGQIECVPEREILAGDHMLFLGRVVRLQGAEAAPLVFHAGRFVELLAEPVG